MTYASISIDRRAAYYVRCAPLIAADPLDFYTRAEKGRRFLASQFNAPMGQPPDVVVNRYLNDVFYFASQAMGAGNASVYELGTRSTVERDSNEDSSAVTHWASTPLGAFQGRV